MVGRSSQQQRLCRVSVWVNGLISTMKAKSGSLPPHRVRKFGHALFARRFAVQSGRLSGSRLVDYVDL